MEGDGCSTALQRQAPWSVPGIHPVSGNEKHRGAVILDLSALSHILLVHYRELYI